MSTLTREPASKVLRSAADLADYFQSFAKSRKAMRVGIEAEFFGVRRETGKAIPYQGKGGVESVLDALSRRFQYEKVLEEGHIIGLQRGRSFITLEPGGQIELSAEPASNVFEIEDQVQGFLRELREISASFPGLTWLAAGIQPFSSLEEVSWVPKKRYEIMSRHFEGRGALSHHMMKLTAANQVNVDYLSEENAMASLRVVLGVTSVVTALFANSSFSEGRPNGYLSRRLEIWNHTDPDRTGLIVEFTRSERTFRDYLDYALAMPMMFIVRAGNWIAVPRPFTFQDYLRHGLGEARATLGDFELHLSAAFPEARIKQYLEIRGVDCQKPHLIPAVAAFWKGILYRADARNQAWKLVSFATEADRLNLHHAVPREGLRAKLGAKPILPIARELLEISCEGLAKQSARGGWRDECVFLERVRKEIMRPGLSPAETLIEKWGKEFRRVPGRLVDYLSVA